MNLALPGFEQLDVYHIGFVVDDVPSAVNTWTKFYGAGPFFYFSNSRYDELRYLGEPVHFTETSAFGKFGRFAVELQKFTFETPMPDLQDILGTQPNTLNHAGYLAEDPAKASARLEALGLPMFLYGRNGGNVFYWHDARDELGHFVEIFNDRDIVRRFHSAVDLAAAGWDGAEPLRSKLPTELESELGQMMHGQT